MRVDGCVDITLTPEEQEYIKNDMSVVKEVCEKMQKTMKNSLYGKFCYDCADENTINLTDEDTFKKVMKTRMNIIASKWDSCCYCDTDSVKLSSKGGERMELKDTIALMISEDWKERFIAEYLQVKIRYNKLHKLIIKRVAGKLDFKTPISLNSWNEQAHYMGLYLYELEKQAAIHGIELP